MFETKLSKLNVESCWILKVIEVESWKLLKVVECWKLFNLESWKMSNIEVVEYWKLSKLNVESCWIFKVESWKLKVVESCRMLKVVEYLKLKVVEYCESVEYWKFANSLSTNKFSKAFILYTIWY